MCDNQSGRMTVFLFLFASYLPTVTGLSNRPITRALSHALCNCWNLSSSFIDIIIQTETEENKLYYTDVLNEVLTENHCELGVQVDVNNEELGTIGDFNLWMLDSLVSFGSTIPVQLRQFEDNVLEGSAVFPPKINNFHGCAIRLIAQEENFLFDVGRFIQRLDRSGLESEILLEVAKRLNCSMALYKSDKMFRYIRFYRNIGTAAFKQLEDGEVDIMIGFLIKDEQTQTLFTTSKPYLYTWLVIALRRPSSTLPVLSWLLSEFDNATWGYIALMLIAPIVCMVLTIHISKLAQVFNVRTSYTRFFAVVESAIGMGTVHLPRGTILRWCFIIWSLGMVVIRATYQGKMFDSYSRLTYPKPPLTVKALIDESYVIYSRPEYMGMLQEHWYALSFNYKRLKNVSVIKDTSQKKALIDSKYLLFSKLRSNDLEDIITEHLRAQYANFLFQKHSVLAPKVNMVIERLFESGIIKYLRMRNEFLKRSNIKVKKLKKPEPITFNRFRYLFVTYFSLLFLSIFIFVGEVAWSLLRRD